MNTTPSRTTLSLRGVVPKAVQLPPPTEPNDQRFWFVWSPQRRRPRQRHPTKDAATTEANRLAALHPGVRFHVYEATCVAKVLK